MTAHQLYLRAVATGLPKSVYGGDGSFSKVANGFGQGGCLHIQISSRADPTLRARQQLCDAAKAGNQAEVEWLLTQNAPTGYKDQVS